MVKDWIEICDWVLVNSWLGFNQGSFGKWIVGLYIFDF